MVLGVRLEVPFGERGLIIEKGYKKRYWGANNVLFLD